MKIFSNFDTEFRQKFLEKKTSQFPASQILLIQRSKYYLVFRVIFPGIFLTVLAGFVFFSFYNKQNYAYVLYPLSFVWGLVVWFHVLRKLLKYKYDFTVVDPQGITTYKQKGILHSSLKQIPADRIRSIQFERNNLLENIFEYGKIEIRTDFTDNMPVGEEDESPSLIGLSYVDKPFKVKTRIADICFSSKN